VTRIESLLPSTLRFAEALLMVSVAKQFEYYPNMKKNSRSIQGESYLIVIRRFSLKEFLLTVAYFAFLIFFLPLQYDNIKARTFLYPIIWMSAAFVVYETFFKRSQERLAILKVGRVIAFFLILYFFRGLIPFCAWINHGTLYVNKKDQSITITIKTFECMMTEGDPDLFEERKITQHLKWVTDFNAKTIDTTKWQKVPFMSSFDKE
jgi:hypothetical protein